MKFKLFTFALFFTVPLAQLYAQPKYLNKKSDIRFLPKVKSGALLQYQVKKYNKMPLESDSLNKENPKIDSTIYQFNIQIEELKDLKLHVYASFSNLRDTLLQAIYEGIKADIWFHFETNRYEIVNYKEIGKTVIENAKRLKENNSLSTRSMNMLNGIISSYQKPKTVKKLFIEIKYVIYPYHRAYPYQRIQLDSTEKKDLLGNPALRVIGQTVLKEKKKFCYQYRRQLYPKVSSDSTLKQRVDGTTILSLDSQEIGENQESYKYKDIVFDKKTGVIQSNVYEEKKTIFGKTIKVKKVYQLIKN